MADRIKGSRPLVITDPTLLVRRANERLVLMRDRKEVAAMPIRDVAHVALHGPVTLTGAALAGILDAGIDVTLYSSAGFYRGSISSAPSRNVYLLLAQVEAWKRDDRRLDFARSLLASKIAGQRALLHRHARDRGAAGCRVAAERLRVLEEGLGEETDVDGARGVEGAAAAQYFAVFGEMLSAGWNWQGRRHRPAPDPVNAVLSFGYALATGEMVRALMRRGFDTRVGMVHGLRYGRESLALDMVEEFRAPMVDRFVLRTLNRRQLSPDDFEDHEGGAVRLGTAGRRRFLEAWEEMMAGRAAGVPNERAVADPEERPGSLRVSQPGETTRGVAAGLEDAVEGEDEGDPAPRWRRRMEVQVLRLWRFLMRGEAYVPMTRTSLSGFPEEGGSQRGEDEEELPEDP